MTSGALCSGAPCSLGPCLDPAPRHSKVGPPEPWVKCWLAVPPLQAVTRRAKVAPAERMSKFLRHFTVVGDDYHAWNINYKKWENEEEEEEEEQPPAVPAAGEEGSPADAEASPVPTPRPPRDFRSTLRKLFSSHRFQVGGAPGGKPQGWPGWDPPLPLPLVHPREVD